MIAVRHTGIYVDDIRLMEEFYTAVFHMHPLCSMEPDEGELFDELLGIQNARILTTKLITPYGRTTGQGDMLELVKVLSERNQPGLPKDRPVSMTGMAHLAFGVDDIRATVEKLLNKNGILRTEIKTMKNGNKCCFCTDPEGNWIELIERNE